MDTSVIHVQRNKHEKHAVRASKRSEKVKIKSEITVEITRKIKVKNEIEMI
jgi:hypothetical protein